MGPNPLGLVAAAKALKSLAREPTGTVVAALAASADDDSVFCNAIEVLLSLLSGPAPFAILACLRELTGIGGRRVGALAAVAQRVLRGKQDMWFCCAS